MDRKAVHQTEEHQEYEAAPLNQSSMLTAIRTCCSCSLPGGGPDRGGGDEGVAPPVELRSLRVNKRSSSMKDLVVVHLGVDLIKYSIGIKFAIIKFEMCVDRYLLVEGLSELDYSCLKYHTVLGDLIINQKND